jgi:hypothetical protein
VDGNGDLAQLTIVPTSHKKDVKALLQVPSLLPLLKGQGRNSKQSSEVAESLFGHLTFRTTLPILGMETS